MPNSKAVKTSLKNWGSKLV